MMDILTYEVSTVRGQGQVYGLRANASAYDAVYVALAEHLGCDLLTADRRLAAAPGTRCTITVIN